ncbi:MAG: hydroxylamine reductase [Deltaproteobacteria bacterium]|nr:hydroxylamine reductase [Deltaproteobacteria bacterium]
MGKCKITLPFVALLCVALMIPPAYAGFPSVPKETYEALKLKKDASPKELYEALTKRYLDPEQGFGEGVYAEYWEPIPFSRYLDPHSFYEPPKAVKEISTREECVKCHTDESPGFVVQWKQSTHANLDKIRKLTKDSPEFYKKKKLEDIEANLRSMGKLGAKENLKEVSCMDCHVDILRTKKADHTKDLRMGTAEVCGTCHLQEFAERESERDTIKWPHDEWKPGRPSHALDYKANVEVEIYAGMAQREIADGCTGCHISQNKCDTCHARHTFSVAESRKSEVCAVCHNGTDHNNWDMYAESRHGLRYSRNGDQWNFDVQLKDAIKKGNMEAPTCQFCHMEYQGKFSHNLVRKVRWANYPFVPGIREVVADSDWAEKRLDAWVKTCMNCHSETYARAWLDLMDKATMHGLDKYDEAREVVHAQYEAGLLPGQKTNRPDPPLPEKEGFEKFYGIFWSKGNNPAGDELKLFEMAEDHLVQLHVSVAHQSWNYAYTVGWSALNRGYVEIMEEDTKMKERMALQARVDRLETEVRNASLLDLDSPNGKLSLGGLGGGLMLAGTLTLAGWRRHRRKNQ